MQFSDPIAIVDVAEDDRTAKRLMMMDGMDGLRDLSDCDR